MESEKPRSNYQPSTALSPQLVHGVGHLQCFHIAFPFAQSWWFLLVPIGLGPYPLAAVNLVISIKDLCPNTFRFRTSTYECTWGWEKEYQIQTIINKYLLKTELEKDMVQELGNIKIGKTLFLTSKDTSLNRRRFTHVQISRVQVQLWKKSE